MGHSFQQDEMNVLTTVKAEACDIKSEIDEIRHDIKLWLSAVAFVFLLLNAATFGLIVAHTF